MWHARVLGGAAVLVLGIFVVLLSRQLPYHSTYGPGPGFLPTWIGYALAACAVVVTVQELRNPDRRETFFQPRTRMAITVAVCVGIAFLLVPVLGFAAAFGVFIGVTMRYMGGHHWIACGAAAVLTALGIHALFGRWLDISLPTGLLGW